MSRNFFEEQDQQGPEGHPVDAAVERAVRHLRLRRRMREAERVVLDALAEHRGLWFELEHLQALYRAERERAYFNLGYQLGMAEGLSRRAKLAGTRGSRQFARWMLRRAVLAELPRAEVLAALLRTAASLLEAD